MHLGWCRFQRIPAGWRRTAVTWTVNPDNVIVIEPKRRRYKRAIPAIAQVTHIVRTAMQPGGRGLLQSDAVSRAMAGISIGMVTAWGVSKAILR